MKWTNSLKDTTKLTQEEIDNLNSPIKFQALVVSLMNSTQTVGDSKLLIYLKSQKMEIIKLIPGWVWWLTPVIPALWEAKVGGLPEVRRLRPW